jgi:hypothetical protein
MIRGINPASCSFASGSVRRIHVAPSHIVFEGQTMDSLLGNLFGGNDSADKSQNRAQDFVSRYEQGAPWDNISDEEAAHNYQAVAGQLSPQELEDSAAETYARLSPEERREFARYLQQKDAERFGTVDFNDPRQLARATSRYQTQQPDGLAGLLGGGGAGGGLNNLIGGALGGGGSKQNPMAKAVMGGIAAMAMKKMMGGR